MRLYRVEFKPSGPVFAMGETANDAKREAADHVGATIRQATAEEIIAWVQTEIEEMKLTLRTIDSSLDEQFNTSKDCE